MSRPLISEVTAWNASVALSGAWPSAGSSRQHHRTSLTCSYWVCTCFRISAIFYWTSFGASWGTTKPSCSNFSMDTSVWAQNNRWFAERLEYSLAGSPQRRVKPGDGCVGKLNAVEEQIFLFFSSVDAVHLNDRVRTLRYGLHAGDLGGRGLGKAFYFGRKLVKIRKLFLLFFWCQNREGHVTGAPRSLLGEDARVYGLDVDSGHAAESGSIILHACFVANMLALQKRSAPES